MTGPIYVCGAEAGDVLEVPHHLLLLHASITARSFLHRTAKSFLAGCFASLLASLLAV